MKTPIYSTIFTDSDRSQSNNFYRYGNNLKEEFDKYNEQLYPFLAEVERTMVDNFKAVNSLEEKNAFHDCQLEELCEQIQGLGAESPGFSLRDAADQIKALNEKIMYVLKEGYDTIQKNKVASENILIVKEFNQKLEPFKDDLHSGFSQLEQNLDIDKDAGRVHEMLNSGLTLLTKCNKIVQKVKLLQLEFLISSDSLVILLDNFQKESLNFDDITATVEYLESFFERMRDRLEQINSLDLSVSSREQAS